MNQTFLSQLSNDLKNSVAQAQPWVVAVRGAHANISGVVIAPNEIVTVAHVLDRNDASIEIITHDGRKLQATLKGHDPRSDLALLHVPNLDLPSANLASNPASIGELVVLVARDNHAGAKAAHGMVSTTQANLSGQMFGGMMQAMHNFRRNAHKFGEHRHGHGPFGGGPFGFGGRFKKHLAEHFAERFAEQNKTENNKSENNQSENNVGFLGTAMIQTDARPFPGSSGGALLNANGELVGIVNAGLMRGQALALPLLATQSSLEAIRSGRAGKRGFLGVTTHAVPLVGVHQELAKQSMGLLVANVATDSPAAKAGLMVGDILVRLSEQNLEHPETLLTALNASVGQTVELSALRGGQITTFSVTVAEATKR